MFTKLGYKVSYRNLITIILVTVACRAVGHKEHMPLMKFKISIFLPLMKKTLMWGADAETSVFLAT